MLGTSGWHLFFHILEFQRTTEFSVFEATLKNETYCYIFEEFFPSSYHGVSWNVARSRCLSLGGDLVSVHSQDEQNLLKSLMTQRWYWLGHNDLKKEGRYTWSDNSNWTFSNWLNGKVPDHKNWKNICGDMRDDHGNDSMKGKWTVSYCYGKGSFICKVKGMKYI